MTNELLVGEKYSAYQLLEFLETDHHKCIQLISPPGISLLGPLNILAQHEFVVTDIKYLSIHRMSQGSDPKYLLDNPYTLYFINPV